MQHVWDPKGELLAAPSSRRLFGSLTQNDVRRFFELYLEAVRPPQRTFDQQSDADIRAFLDRCKSAGFSLIIDEPEAITLCRRSRDDKQPG